MILSTNEASRFFTPKCWAAVTTSIICSRISCLVDLFFSSMSVCVCNATVIHQELAALFPGTAYTDRGHHDFDSFPLGSVPRKDNK